MKTTITPTENYRGIDIEVTAEDNHSCANFIFIYEGKEYRGAQGMRDENEAAAEAFRLIDSILKTYQL